eukprot:2540512-Prymnesium_polylepis.1
MHQTKGPGASTPRPPVISQASIPCGLLTAHDEPQPSLARAGLSFGPFRCSRARQRREHDEH